ncbi:MAG: DNA alkylation repair protein [Candidatus Aminicenantales bacterium]
MTAETKKERKSVSPEDLAKKIVNSLRAKADPEKAVQIQRYFKENVSSYGLAAEDIREIARDLYESVRRNWTIEEAIDLCEILLPNKYLEVKSTAEIFFLRFQKDFGRPVFSLIKKWLAQDYCDNWASVDGLCPDGLGGLMEKYPDLVHRIKGWTAHPNMWVKRASAVAFIKLARKGKYLDVVYQISRKLFPFEEDLIEKANGWLLREAGKTDIARLEKFLYRHGPKIPRTTLRYAIERFPEAKRKHLLEKTRER